MAKANFDQDAIQVVEATDVEVVDPDDARKRAIDRMEDNVLTRNLEIFEDAAHFADIEPGDFRVPPEWIQEVGFERAVRRHRVAQAAWMSAKEAPVGLMMAKAVVTAAVKGRAEHSTKIGTLNVGKVLVVGDVPTFPRKEVER